MSIIPTKKINEKFFKVATQTYEELFKKVCRLVITCTKTEVQTIKRRRTVYHHKQDYVYDFTFDTVVNIENTIIAKGKSIVLYDIKEDFVLKEITAYILNEDKEYESIFKQEFLIDYPKGGTFTFSGKLTLSVTQS